MQARPVLWVAGQICQVEVDPIMGEMVPTTDPLMMRGLETTEDPPDLLWEEVEEEFHPMTLQGMAMAREEVTIMTPIETAGEDAPGQQPGNRFHWDSSGTG